MSATATASLWGRFTVSRVWLALTGMAPLAVMDVLAEAHARGVLRQVGGSYQFRHAELKEALLPAQEAGRPRPQISRPRSRRCRSSRSGGERQRHRGDRLPAGDRDGRTQRIAQLLRDGRPTLVGLTGGETLARAAKPWSDRVDRITAVAADAPAPALLIRPDGYVAWSTADTGSLAAAPIRWFGTQPDAAE